MKKKILRCSVGICVYNEEKNIAQLLRSLLSQKLTTIKVDEILIIDSGSTDSTVQIITTFVRKNKKIQIIHEKKRSGKPSAVNIFIRHARNDVLVLVGGDLILSPQLIQRLVKPFMNERVGMTGGRPIPINKLEGVAGYAAHLLWELHHRVALIQPKMGEAIVFRKIFYRVPPVSGADEASIEPLIRGQGYDIVYVPNAIVYNKAPSTVSDFILQRRRNYCLHLIVKHEQRYIVSTLNSGTTIRALISYIRDVKKPRYMIYLPIVIMLESLSRFLGWWDYRVAHKRHTVWEIAHSTKNLG